MPEFLETQLDVVERRKDFEQLFWRHGLVPQQRFESEAEFRFGDLDQISVRSYDIVDRRICLRAHAQYPVYRRTVEG